MKLAALALLLASCGGTVTETVSSRDAFVDAVCSHTPCPGWPEPQVCQYSYHAALAKLGAQDEACMADATAIVSEPGCGALIQTTADDVVGGRCSR